MMSAKGIEAFDINFASMTAERYCEILRDKVVPYFRKQRNNTKFFQQDGAPPHYATTSRNVLDDQLSNRWIGRRSADLTPCDFFLWGVLRQRVYARSPKTKMQLATIIEEEITAFNSTVFPSVYDSFLQRCNVCVDNDGGHFKHL